MRRHFVVAGCFALSVATAAAEVVTGDNAFAELSFEELLSVELTSAARRSQSVEDSASSVFVITRDDIRRSPARNVPELLRMVPGVQVARIDHNNYKVSIRGGNQLYANKLLVMIDGRSVYTPTFGGVFWDQHDLLLEDIERIEVIRGPGGTVWGANATNGVINVITRAADDTTGLYVNLEAGDEDQPTAGLRLGTTLPGGGAARLSAIYSSRPDISPNPLTLTPAAYWQEAADAVSAVDGPNEYETAKLSFRLDQPIGDAVRLTFDTAVQSGEFGQGFGVGAGFVQAHGLLRLERDTTRGTMSLQVYADHSDRESYRIGIVTNTADIDFSHAFDAGRHAIVWGAGFRAWRDEFTKVVTDPEASDWRASLFAQDEISLADERLRLTFGSKFEYNSVTGFEVQPNLRALYQLTDRRTVWAALSRNVRTPSRGDRFLQFANYETEPAPVAIVGVEDLDAETALTAEIGYRSRVTDRLSLEAAAFLTRYDGLVSEIATPLQPPASPIFVNTFDNDGFGTAKGIELAANLQPLRRLTTQLAYAYVDLDHDCDTPPAVMVPGLDDILFRETGTARHLASLRSTAELPGDLTGTLWTRYTSEPALQDVGDHVDLDLRLTWSPAGPVQASLIGENLLDGDDAYETEAYIAQLTELSPSTRRLTAKLELDF